MVGGLPNAATSRQRSAVAWRRLVVLNRTGQGRAPSPPHHNDGPLGAVHRHQIPVFDDPGGDAHADHTRDAVLPTDDRDVGQGAAAVAYAGGDLGEGWRP